MAFLYIYINVENNTNIMKMKVIFNYKNLFLAIITLMSLWLIFFFIKESIFNYKFLATLAMLGLAWAIVVFDKIFKLRIPSFMYNAYYYFLIISIFLGGILGLNDLIFWYDMLQHFIAGIFLSFIVIFIIVRLDNIGYLKFSLIVLFVLFFVGFSKAVWELTEFTIDRIFNLDIQKVEASGITNTMVDIIMGFLGSFVVIILLLVDNAVYNNKYLELLIKRF